MRRYFFFLQGEKRRRCRASTRLFNAAERKKNKKRFVGYYYIIPKSVFGGSHWGCKHALKLTERLKASIYEYVEIKSEVCLLEYGDTGHGGRTLCLRILFELISCY